MSAPETQTGVASSAWHPLLFWSLLKLCAEIQLLCSYQEKANKKKRIEESKEWRRERDSHTNTHSLTLSLSLSLSVDWWTRSLLNILFGAEPSPAHCFQLSLYLSLSLSLFLLRHTVARSLTRSHTGVFREKQSAQRGGSVWLFSSSFLPSFFPATLVFTPPQSKKERERERGGRAR